MMDWPKLEPKLDWSKLVLAKIGFGKNWIGQNWSNQDGQNGIGQSRSLVFLWGSSRGILVLLSAWARNLRRHPKRHKKRKNGAGEKQSEILGCPADGGPEEGGPEEGRSCGRWGERTQNSTHHTPHTTHHTQHTTHHLHNTHNNTQ